MSSNAYQIATAVQDSNDNLKVIGWDVDSVTGNVIRTEDASAGKVGQISSTICRSFLVTALQDSQGNLKIISWKIDRGAITRKGDSGNAGGKIDLVSAVGVGNDMVATAVKDSEGNLKVIGWKIDETGAIRKIGESGNVAGKIKQVSVGPAVFPGPDR
jgi:hypothetical protein